MSARRKPAPPKMPKKFLDDLEYGNALLFFNSSRGTLRLAHLGVLGGLICVGIYNIVIAGQVECNSYGYDKLHQRTVFDTCAALASRNDTQLGVVKMFDGTEWVAEWDPEIDAETNFGMSRNTKTFRSILLIVLPLVFLFSLQFVFRYVVVTYSFGGFNRQPGQGNAGLPELRAAFALALRRRRGVIAKMQLLVYVITGGVALAAEAAVVIAAYIVMTSDYHTVDDCTCVDDVVLERAAGVMSFLFAVLYLGIAGGASILRKPPPTTHYVAMDNV